MPAGAGKAVFERVCGACHAASVVIGSRHNADGWSDVIEEMVIKGAVISKADQRTILRYLVKNFPKQANEGNR